MSKQNQAVVDFPDMATTVLVVPDTCRCTHHQPGHTPITSHQPPAIRGPFTVSRTPQPTNRQLSGYRKSYS
eukprot:3630687-Rhodomonas_salina.2